MTWSCLAINASAGSPAYAAQLFRNALSALLTPHTSGSARPLGSWSGRRPGAWLVTAATPGSAITIAPGSGVLDVETPVATSAYLVASDANDTTLTLGARHATLDRIDIVSVRVDDTDVDASGNRQAIPVYTPGTAGSGAPATPARCLRVCTVLVPSVAAGTGTVVTMDSVHTVAAGGLLPVAAGVRPTTPYTGQPIYDGGALHYNGTTWVPFGEGALRRIVQVATWADFSSTSMTALATCPGLAVPKWAQDGTRTALITARINATAISAAFGAQVRIGLGATVPPEAPQVFNGDANNSFTIEVAGTFTIPASTTSLTPVFQAAKITAGGALRSSSGLIIWEAFIT